MSYYQPRIPLRFESADGNTVLDFPLAEYEWESEQSLYAPEVALVGAHYSYDMLRDGVSVKQSGRERLRFVVYEDSPSGVDTVIDELLAKCVSLGRGKLWTVDSADVERWAWARALMKPSLRWAAGDILRKTASVEFRRDSDWYDEDPIGEDGEFTVTGDPDNTIVVNNPGNAHVYNAIITLKGPFSAHSITNTTTGYVLQSTRDGGSNDWLRYDAGANTVKLSDDSGATWADDSSLFVRTDGQVQLMVMAPGDNAITVVGADAAELVVELYGAWE